MLYNETSKFQEYNAKHFTAFKMFTKKSQYSTYRSLPIAPITHSIWENNPQNRSQFLFHNLQDLSLSLI